MLNVVLKSGSRNCPKGGRQGERHDGKVGRGSCRNIRAEVAAPTTATPSGREEAPPAAAALLLVSPTLGRGAQASAPPTPQTAGRDNALVVSGGRTPPLQPCRASMNGAVGEGDRPGHPPDRRPCNCGGRTVMAGRVEGVAVWPPCATAGGDPSAGGEEERASRALIP